MNGFRGSFMGQIPLVLGPSSWGAGMVSSNPIARCPEGTFMDENGVCRPRLTMGQDEKPTCEPTAEGGYRCSDGTYLPPGCAAGSSQAVKATPPGGGFPYLTVGLVAAGIAAGVAVLAGKKMGATALETSYPEAASKLSDYASRISSERAADAFNFQQYIAAGKKRQDLVFAQKDAQAALDEQQKKWDTAHRNADELAAAQAAFDKISGDLASAAQDKQTYQEAMNTNQANIASYLSNATYLIGTLPEDFQGEAKAIIEPCFKPAMKGSSMRGGMQVRPLMVARF